MAAPGVALVLGVDPPGKLAVAVGDVVTGAVRVGVEVNDTAVASAEGVRHAAALGAKATPRRYSPGRAAYSIVVLRVTVL